MMLKRRNRKRKMLLRSNAIRFEFVCIFGGRVVSVQRGVGISWKGTHCFVHPQCVFNGHEGPALQESLLKSIANRMLSLTEEHNTLSMCISNFRFCNNQCTGRNQATWVSNALALTLCSGKKCCTKHSR